MRPTHHPKERVEEAAQVESLLKKDNAATSRLNGEIAAANQRMIKEVAAMPLHWMARRAEVKARMTPRVSLPHQRPSWVKEVLGAERNNQRVLTNRKPAVWAKAVAEIADPVLRGAVACVVWWDYFGGQMSPQRRAHLDAHLVGASASAVPDAQLEAGLVRVGYTPYAAWSRSIAAKPYKS